MITEKMRNIIEQVEKLFLSDINYDIPEYIDDIPVFMWLCGYCKHTKTIGLFLQHGYNVNEMDKNGFTPLMWACSYNPNVRIVKKLIHEKASVNLFHGPNLLALAVLNNNSPDVVKLLINIGFNINIQDEKGKSLLMVACKNHNIAMMSTLLKSGININLADDQGNTVIHQAILDNAPLAIIEALLKAGSDFYLTPNNDGFNALELALIYYRNIDLIKMFLENTPEYKREQLWKLIRNYKTTHIRKEYDDLSGWITQHFIIVKLSHILCFLFFLWIIWMVCLVIFITPKNGG